MGRKLHIERNCGLPRFGGADPTRKNRVWWAGYEPLKHDQPHGPARTLHVLTECPKSFISEDSLGLLEVYALHQRTKALPESGGLFDQPALVMEAFVVIANEVSKVEAQEARDKERKDRNRR